MFRRKPSAIEPPSWMILGLGNPGPEYRGTRHNVGFEVIDAIADQFRIKLSESKHKARYGIGTVAGASVALVKPLTFMNLSGEAAAPLAKMWSLTPDRILVVADDLDMVTGRVRMKPKGSAGGHNGHKSLIRHLGTEEYPRIKIGISRVDRSETVDHVLGTFPPDERERINEAVRHVIRGIEVLMDRGLDAAITFVNESRS
jgi:PTH1 family peptidyl-tRNA hydrolase